MSFEEFYQNFYNMDSDKVSITKQEYNSLKEKAQHSDQLMKKAEELALENKKLTEEMEKINSMEKRDSELTIKAESYLNSLKRLQADFENYRKNVERIQERNRIKFTFEILKKLINHLDDLKRASEVLDTIEVNESFKKGFNMIVENFENLLKEYGIRLMNTMGEKFDPYKHEAILTENNANVPEGTILQELENGFYYNDEVLRPAKVKISKKDTI